MKEDVTIMADCPNCGFFPVKQSEMESTDRHGWYRVLCQKCGTRIDIPLNTHIKLYGKL